MAQARASTPREWVASAQDPVAESIPGAAVCPATAESCVSVVVNSGTFKNNGFNLPIGDGDMIIAAEAGAGEGVSTVLLPRDDGHFGVYAKPMTVPGGVLGIDLPFNNLFGLAGVTAEVQAVGVPVFNDLITNMDISLPVRMKINNAFLGNNCYLGSETAPVNFHLTPTADSSPAFEVAPSGSLKVSPVKSATTDFAIPSASGCGPFGVLNPIVNWRAKAPATSGTSLNTVSTAYLFPGGIDGSDPLDDLGGGTGSLGSSGSSGS
ncbi:MULTISPECIES: hypothetical protein [Rhodococcus]|uniref:Uncharacterized protein n=2 Tax=Nocardiaceae TaxID=85025 RepID=A0ABU4BTR7_RHOGO|nr:MULTISPECIES: hypothetical protein [Rhodococcus]MDV6267613.1 hypothetical protein [Rhodococcus globerulus]MDV8065610.1 hypothetical protein [Rhodococcus sp. IEGM 1366]